MPVATEAFQILAPSQCRCSPASSASARSPSSTGRGWMVPPARLWVFSTAMALVGTP